MIDSNISMEEDTELRDLVVQTLDNNGALSKVRAELRASIFLALEEHESILTPEPLLNKKVKQCLENSEGKLLFSLVREFLEYFGLEYSIAVFDPETYAGKEYTYEGREKLRKDLGLDYTKEPLLGEILKNTINCALNDLQKNQTKTNDVSNNAVNSTFDISVPKVLSKDSESSSSEASEKMNDKQNESRNSLSDESEPIAVPDLPNGDSKPEHIISPLGPLSKNTTGKNSLFFNEIIVDGKKEKFTAAEENDLPPISTFHQKTSYELPTFNGSGQGNINELKELMDIAQGLHNYDDDFNSSASGSGNEQSPTKELKSQHSENISENIDEEISSSNSCLENISITNLIEGTLNKDGEN